MLALLVLSISILLQLTAAFYAIRLIKVTGKSYTWLFIASAIVLMCCRRIIPFFHSMLASASYRFDMVNESIGLIVSLLILLGVLGVGQIFVELKRAELALREFDRLRMSALQGKANPHFLFNTLNGIAYLMAENRKDEAEAALYKLSAINRYLVELADNDIVGLEEGLRMLQSYFELEQLRYGDRLTLKVSIEGDGNLVRLPGLTLQPIVENSIKHGFGPRGGYGNVIIAVVIKNEKARITISDDGIGCEDVEKVQGYGIRIVRARLELCFGKRFSMEMHGEKGKGVTTIITVPVRSSAA